MSIEISAKTLSFTLKFIQKARKNKWNKSCKNAKLSIKYLEIAHQVI